MKNLLSYNQNRARHEAREAERHPERFVDGRRLGMVEGARSAQCARFRAQADEAARLGRSVLSLRIQGARGATGQIIEAVEAGGWVLVGQTDATFNSILTFRRA
jgi:hypothetical protein